ncbi:MAG: hypothetical protein JJLCMIEE_01163 [Acidimicrobiales bacterium]|nr:hypothetical protein [Acidimicrobiales bacterium]
MNTAVTNPLARGQIPKRSPSPQVSTFGEDLTTDQRGLIRTVATNDGSEKVDIGPRGPGSGRLPVTEGGPICVWVVVEVSLDCDEVAEGLVELVPDDFAVIDVDGLEQRLVEEAATFA